MMVSRRLLFLLVECDQVQWRAPADNENESRPECACDRLD